MENNENETNEKSSGILNEVDQFSHPTKISNADKERFNNLGKMNIIIFQKMRKMMKMKVKILKIIMD